MTTFTLLIEQGSDGYLLAEVAELPGCRTQAKTRETLLARAKEAISLYLEEQPGNERQLELERIDVHI